MIGAKSRRFRRDRLGLTRTNDSIAAAAAADPGLSSMRYRASAGAIVERTESTAVGSLEVTVEGVPEDLSEAGKQHLETSEIAWPMSLQTPQQQLHLIRRGRSVGGLPPHDVAVIADWAETGSHSVGREAGMAAVTDIRLSAAASAAADGAAAAPTRIHKY